MTGSRLGAFGQRGHQLARQAELVIHSSAVHDPLPFFPKVFTAELPPAVMVEGATTPPM